MSGHLISWISLITAGLFEVIWAIFLKNSKGFTDIFSTVMFAITLIISMLLLSYSMKTIPLGIAYPVWTGIGAVGSVIVGILFFKESSEVIKMVFTMVILVGIIGLKLSSKQ